MAGGLLSIVGLYSYGFRENRQSREDVASAAYADAVFSPLVMALSATNLKWSVFATLESQPAGDGWAAYVDSAGLVKGDPDSLAESAFNATIGRMKRAAIGSLDVPSAYPKTASGGLTGGLLVMHEQGQSTVRLAFRAARNKNELMAAPMYYTEVRFQGLPNE
jgi:hypothetical protein